MDKYSYLSNSDVSAIEELYNQFRKDPGSIDEGWKKFFEGFEFARTDFSAEGAPSENMHKEFKVLNLIHGYRTRGHLFTRTNPVRERRKYSPKLDIENFGLEEADLDVEFQAGEEIGIGKATLRKIVEHLESVYCDSIGSEYMYIRDPERQGWIKERLELKNLPKIERKDRLHIMHKLNQATVFEEFLQKKFVGQKRFSIEGAEAVIPALDAVVEKGADLGVKHFVMGMAHRGRLNVLANIFNKTYQDIFSEFEGKDYEDSLFDGDVKYHLGFSCTETTDNGKEVQLTLSPNPSHLEAVNPVVEGIARGKIDHEYDNEKEVCPILIHGDSAVAGQGVVYEVVQMAQLDGFKTGGTLHLVINNQVGFTTNYLDARSSTYCTDVGKTTLCPVFHVNGDDVEAVVQTMQLALEYRQKFGRDVFVDLLCYRKYGHNEGDEPKFTQPKLYKAIAKHPNPRQIYMNKLSEQNLITKAEGEAMQKEFHEMLDQRLSEAKEIEKAKVTNFLEDGWSHLKRAHDEDFNASPNTGFAKKKLLEIGKKMCTLPEGKKFFRKVVRLHNLRLKMLEEDQLDWGMGEMLAYATLLAEGHPIRLTGQDVERGTFSHRHAVVKTEDNEEEIITLNSIAKGQANYEIYNSLLSEYAVMGFEYGYAFAVPDGLSIWEAQFGDFNNGAQIIIDQFLSSAEDKWGTMNGLVLLLPHGYEGMGSEHSSARMERYLQLCAENNMVVANCTTPANYFHLLRRQLKWKFRKPLIVFTPKKLLRYPKAMSKLEEMSNGRFSEVLDDPGVVAKEVDTIAFCSGKIYYDILEEKEKREGGNNIAAVRLEQLYPMPKVQIEAILKKYKKAKNFIWVQEEPENMGPWNYIQRKFPVDGVKRISRPESGSPASGSSKVHERRQQAILDELFTYAAILAK